MHINRYRKTQNRADNMRICTGNTYNRGSYEEECVRRLCDFGGNTSESKYVAVVTLPFIRRFLTDSDYRQSLIDLLMEIDEEICEMDLIEDLSNGCNPRMEL